MRCSNMMLFIESSMHARGYYQRPISFKLSVTNKSHPFVIDSIRASLPLWLVYFQEWSYIDLGQVSYPSRHSRTYPARASESDVTFKRNITWGISSWLLRPFKLATIVLPLIAINCYWICPWQAKRQLIIFLHHYKEYNSEVGEWGNYFVSSFCIHEQSHK